MSWIIILSISSKSFLVFLRHSLNLSFHPQTCCRTPSSLRSSESSLRNRAIRFINLRTPFLFPRFSCALANYHIYLVRSRFSRPVRRRIRLLELLRSEISFCFLLFVGSCTEDNHFFFRVLVEACLRSFNTFRICF